MRRGRARPPRPLRSGRAGATGGDLPPRKDVFSSAAGGLMGLAFVPLGVGDAFSALRYSSCVAVEAEGRWLLVDCPHPIRKILREGSARAGVALDVGSFEAVVVTHVHADHASGLEVLGFYS